jgi:6-phosphogluconolactonase
MKARSALLAALLAGLAVPLAGLAEEKAPAKFMVYVGTYTGGKGKSEGIYRLELDLATGKLSAPALAAKTINPSFLAIHPTGKFLFAVGEFGPKVQGVNAFAIDQRTGDLTFLGGQSSGGDDPCHVCLDSKGQYAFAANYGGGSAVALPIGEDGKLGKRTGFVQHKGKGANPSRQEKPHAHSINLSRDDRFAFVADLGLDKVLVYQFDRAKGTLTANDPPALVVAPGSGPRHFAFHPTGKFAYVINELASTIDACTYDAEKGELKSVQTISTLPRGFKGRTTTAEVVVHPSGKFVYGSNRGHDSIAVFRVDPRSGKLTLVEHQKENIKEPRNFAVDPTGKYLIAGSQRADLLAVFKVDPETGKLTPTGQTVQVGAPVCVRFLAWPR